MLTIFISQKEKQEALKKWQKQKCAWLLLLITNLHSIVVFSTYPKEKDEALLVE